MIDFGFVIVGSVTTYTVLDVYVDGSGAVIPFTFNAAVAFAAVVSSLIGYCSICLAAGRKLWIDFRSAHVASSPSSLNCNIKFHSNRQMDKLEHFFISFGLI